MTRNEAIRTIGDMFAFAGHQGKIDGGPSGAGDLYVQAMEALGVDYATEIVPVALRASAEFRGEEPS